MLSKVYIENERILKSQEKKEMSANTFLLIFGTFALCHKYLSKELKERLGK